MTQPTEQPKKGFHLRYGDYRKIVEFIEDSYRHEKNDDVIDFNSIPPDIKDLLWKVKTVIRNMESVRLRTDNNIEEK